MDGYMTEVDFDGQTLKVRGKNKAARIALAGEDHGTDVVVPVSQIASATFKRANSLVNGNLVVHTTAGKKYQLHFRKKQQADFEGLARSLGAVS